MSKENRSGKGKGDAEYQYSEDQMSDLGEPEPEEEPPKKPPKAPGAFKKKLFIALAVLSGISMIYQYLSHRNKAPPAPETQIATTAAPQQPAAAPKPVQPVEVTTTVVSPAEVKKEIGNIEGQGGAASDAQVRELQAGVQQMGQSVDDLQSALLTLATSVQKLSAEVKQLTDMQEMQAQTINKLTTHVGVKKKVKTAREKGLMVYNIRAIIPGRAWLYSPQGGVYVNKLITVKAGDTLRGYGTVLSINSEQGTVGTSSGTTITYGYNDS